MFWNRKRGTAAHPQQQATVEDLRTRAGEALVKADDAVRAADEELSYAQAQFGLSATDAFTQALNAARDHLARSFELRRLLDDDIPETEPQQRQMYTEILQRCTDAVTAITAQEEEFNKRRGLEANLPTTIAETAQRAQEAEQVIRAARTLLVTLHATYPDSALTSVSEAPERAGRLLSAGRTALDQARASLEAGQHSTAVEQVRIAQGTIAQAGELAAQVTSTRERLSSAVSDLQAAIASISSDLTDAERLSDQVPEASLAPLVADAKAAITEGRAACTSETGGDPLAALDHLTRAEAAIDDALAPGRAPGGAPPPGRPPGGGGGGGPPPGTRGSGLAFLEPALDRQDDDGADHGEDQTADGEDPVVGGIEDQLAEPTGEQGTEGTEGGGGDPAAAFLPGHDRLGDAAADQADDDVCDEGEHVSSMPLGGVEHHQVNPRFIPVSVRTRAARG